MSLAESLRGRGSRAGSRMDARPQRTGGARRETARSVPARPPAGRPAKAKRFLPGPAPPLMQKSRARSAPRPGPAAGSLRGGGVRPTGRPRRGRARAPPARRPPCPSARFLRRRLRGERGAQLLPPRPAPAGVGEAAEAPPAPPTPEAARPPRGHLRRWHNGSPSAGGGSASPLLPSPPHIHTQSLPPTPPLPPSAAAAAPATRAPGGRAGLTPPPCPPRSRRSPLTPGRGSPRPAVRRHARARAPLPTRRGGSGGGGARGRRCREMSGSLPLPPSAGSASYSGGSQ